jgi:hypothetical protein
LRQVGIAADQFVDERNRFPTILMEVSHKLIKMGDCSYVICF